MNQLERQVAFNWNKREREQGSTGTSSGGQAVAASSISWMMSTARSVYLVTHGEVLFSRERCNKWPERFQGERRDGKRGRRKASLHLMVKWRRKKRLAFSFIQQKGERSVKWNKVSNKCLLIIVARIHVSNWIKRLANIQLLCHRYVCTLETGVSGKKGGNKWKEEEKVTKSIEFKSTLLEQQR